MPEASAFMAIRDAKGAADIAVVRRLFLAYAESLSFNLCFQDFDTELATLPGAYARPRGGLWLAWRGPEAIGCVGLRPLEGNACEMKRLYVTPAGRAAGLGRRLAIHCIDAARERSYGVMRLDTIRGEMAAAEGLYRSLGFAESEPYYDSPIPGVIYYALRLTTQAARTGWLPP